MTFSETNQFSVLKEIHVVKKLKKENFLRLKNYVNHSEWCKRRGLDIKLVVLAQIEGL